MWEDVDLGGNAELLRGRPEINDVGAVRGPDGRVYLLVEQQGMSFGTILRDVVLETIGPAAIPDLAIVMVRRIGPDADRRVRQARSAVDDGRWVFTYEPPATGPEREMAELVSATLGTRRVSMGDSLSVMGADSLVVVELHAAISAHFNVPVNMMDLFDAADLRSLTRLVTADAVG